MIWVRFPVLAGLRKLEFKDRLVFGQDEASVVIWTTTPWTIPQNRAVAFNPTIAYGLYRVDAVGENSTAQVGRGICAGRQAGRRR